MFIENQFCLLHVHCDKIFIKYNTVIKVWFCHTFFQRLLTIDQPNIHPVADIFHLLAKDVVVHEFENIFLKPMYGFKHAFKFQTEIQRLFQIFVMKNIFLLFIQVRNKFLNFIDFNPLWSECIFIVQIMNLLWIFQVTFKNTSSPLLIRKFSPIFKICHPLETSHRQWQTHLPTIEIVSVLTRVS